MLHHLNNSQNNETTAIEFLEFAEQVQVEGKPLFWFEKTLIEIDYE